MMEESIYNLISRPAETVTKPAMYRSKHNATMPPTGSTFGMHGTAKLTSNESGNYTAFAEPPTLKLIHVAKKPHATFGKEILGSISPQSYLKRMSETLPPVRQNKSYQRPLMLPKRPPVPQKAEKPVMGLVTEKNFIVANAVDNILAAPKKPAPPPSLATQSSTFGKVPGYLNKVKKAVNKEYAMIGEMSKQQGGEEGDRMRLLSDAEKSEIISGLKKKWDDTHKQYQSLTFNIDTITKIQRKEGLEVDMEQIEKAIQKLSKKNIYVYDDTM
jgi:hypothetical protein